jgi:hypothetical protein
MPLQIFFLPTEKEEEKQTENRRKTKRQLNYQGGTKP